MANSFILLVIVVADYRAVDADLATGERKLKLSKFLPNLGGDRTPAVAPQEPNVSVSDSRSITGYNSDVVEEILEPEDIDDAGSVSARSVESATNYPDSSCSFTFYLFCIL